MIAVPLNDKAGLVSFGLIRYHFTEQRPEELYIMDQEDFIMRKSLMKGIIIFGAVLTAVMLSAVLLQAQEKVPIIIPLSTGDKVVGDAVAGDVRSGKTFSSEAAGINVTGTLDVSGSGSCSAAPVRKTGQETCYDDSGGTGTVTCTNTGQDGDLQKGVTWPSPRFTDNSNGTVTDNLTGLVWTKDANCATKDWAGALAYANAVFPGYSSGADDDCGIDDGSSAGDWRLPNVEELLSLVDREYSGPALSDLAGTAKHGTGTTDAFTGVVTSENWTSSTYVSSPDFAWVVPMSTGASSSWSKVSGANVWLVRDATP